MEERDHSYLISIPRTGGGSYSVMLGSGYFTESEEDTEANARKCVTDSISDCKMSVVLTKHLVAEGKVKEEQLVTDDEADDYPDDLDYDAATCRKLSAEEAKTTESDGWWG
jgi:hypothetical protein